MLNAGAGPFVGLDIPALIIALLTRPYQALTYPTYILERKGLMTDDGIGWTWQCNVFGHYVLVRRIHHATSLC